MKGEVIGSEEEVEETNLEKDELQEDEEGKTPKKTKKEKIAKPKVGDVLNYTREVDTYVIDEEGNRVLCNEENKNMIQAKILSLLFEIKQMLEKKKNE